MIDIDYSKCNVPRRLESVIREQLGHTKILWETVLGQSLAGRVVRSALKGDPECMFEIFLPEGTYLNRLP